MSLSASDIIALFKSRGRGEPPSALSDVFINPLVSILNFLDSGLNLANAEQTVDTIVALLGDSASIQSYATSLNESTDTITAHLRTALEAIASNFGITRRAASYSNGFAFYYTNSNPSGLLPITIGVGRTIFAPTLNQQYRVTSTITFNSVPPIDSVTGRYYFTVPVTSANTGAISNAGVGTLTLIQDAISGIQGVNNLSSIVGGQDQESDSALAARIKQSLAANNIGTKSGYTNTILSGVSDVKGVSVVGAGDPLMTRDKGDGGAVDIYVTDPVPVSINEPITSNMETIDLTYLYIAPSRQPVINDVTTVIPQPDHIVKDTTEGKGGSIKAQDKLAYLIAGAPVVGSSLSYQANNLVAEVQDFIDVPERKILGADVLVREAYVIRVDIVAQIVVLSGYISTNVQTQAQATVESLVASLNIGEELDQSRIIDVISEIPGVGEVVIPLTRFNKTSESTAQVNSIIPAANEVLRPNLVRFTS